MLVRMLKSVLFASCMVFYFTSSPSLADDRFPFTAPPFDGEVTTFSEETLASLVDNLRFLNPEVVFTGNQSASDLNLLLKMQISSEKDIGFRIRNSWMDLDGKIGWVDKDEPDMVSEGRSILQTPSLKFQLMIKDGIARPYLTANGSSNSYWQLRFGEGRVYSLDENTALVSLPTILTDKEEGLNHVKNGHLAVLLKRANKTWQATPLGYYLSGWMNAQEIPYIVQASLLNVQTEEVKEFGQLDPVYLSFWKKLGRSFHPRSTSQYENRSLSLLSEVLNEEGLNESRIIRQFSMGLPPAYLTNAGIAFLNSEGDGVIYSTGEMTHFAGETQILPNSNEAVHGIWSQTKSMFGPFIIAAMMADKKIAQFLPSSLLDLPLIGNPETGTQGALDSLISNSKFEEAVQELKTKYLAEEKPGYNRTPDFRKAYIDVTLRNLLNMDTGVAQTYPGDAKEDGIRNVNFVDAFVGGDDRVFKDYMAKVNGSVYEMVAPMAFMTRFSSPGKVVRYSDFNLTLLGLAVDQIIKSVYGSKYFDPWDYLADKVYKPMGLREKIRINRPTRPDDMGREGMGMPIFAFGGEFTVKQQLALWNLFFTGGRYGDTQLLDREFIVSTVNDIRSGHAGKSAGKTFALSGGDHRFYSGIWIFEDERGERYPSLASFGSNLTVFKLLGKDESGLPLNIVAAYRRASFFGKKWMPGGMIELANKLGQKSETTTLIRTKSLCEKSMMSFSFQ